MNDELLAAIADKNIAEGDLRRAIGQLSRMNEPPSFWNDIATNTGYSRVHRICCILELFRRHVSVGMRLDSFAQLLGDPKWLRDEDVEVVIALNGEIPVTWNFEDTIIVLRLLPESASDSDFAIYLRISGKVSRGDLISVLHRKDVIQEIKAATILEVGFAEPYRHSITS